MIDNNFGFDQIVKGLTFVDGFRVYLAISDATTTAAILEALPRVVTSEREEPSRLVTIVPPDVVTYESLCNSVLAKLVYPPDGVQPDCVYSARERWPAVGDFVILVLNASMAKPSDKDAWWEMFGRMNERRNVISQGLRCPLVFCMPPWLEQVFAHNAPDFWSIRSGAYVVESTEDSKDSDEGSVD